MDDHARSRHTSCYRDVAYAEGIGLVCAWCGKVLAALDTTVSTSRKPLEISAEFPYSWLFRPERT